MKQKLFKLISNRSRTMPELCELAGAGRSDIEKLLDELIREGSVRRSGYTVQVYHDDTGFICSDCDRKWPEVRRYQAAKFCNFCKSERQRVARRKPDLNTAWLSRPLR